jgi:hypothetical protein
MKERHHGYVLCIVVSRQTRRSNDADMAFLFFVGRRVIVEMNGYLEITARLSSYVFCFQLQFLLSEIIG